MPYNQYNNDLPAPPVGWSSWRAAYAAFLDHMSSRYEGDLPPKDAYAIFDGREGAVEVPYWKMAHYAAREQVEEQANYPTPGIDGLLYVNYLVLRDPPRAHPAGVLEWLNHLLDKAKAQQG